MSRKIIAVVWCLLLGVLYAYDPLLLFTIPFACLISLTFVFFMTRQKLETVVSAYLLSFCISYILNYTATFLIGFIFMFSVGKTYTPGTPIDYNQPIYILIYALIAIIQLILSILIFCIRRFRKGFLFIFKRFTIVVALVFSGIILIFVTLVNMLTTSSNSFYYVYLVFAGVVIVGIGIYILIRRLIMMYQRSCMQQNTADYYEKLWEEDEEKIKELDALVKDQSSILHNFADRIDKMEQNALEQENLELLRDVRQLKKDFQEKMDGRNGKQILPSTNNSTIDNLFRRFANQFAEGHIHFSLMINGSIVYMLEHVVQQSELETLIVNHLKDAQIAVNASDNPLRRIAVTLGILNDVYVFTVYDSGIPFEVDTLVRLGTGRVTTRADSGGSGIGFETTFKIMQDCGASLIINEQEQSRIDYTKSVSIRFDGKNQFIIETYRQTDFPDSERYVIVSNEK
jgi:hypothetical protein